jgi:hypothetical protein
LAESLLQTLSESVASAVVLLVTAAAAAAAQDLIIVTQPWVAAALVDTAEMVVLVATRMDLEPLGWQATAAVAAVAVAQEQAKV